jgi:hypothetical protein
MMRNSELEAKEFRIQTTNEFKEFREHTSTEFKEFREQISNIQKQIANEAKEFHGRLCTIEERYLQIITGKKKKGE